jgi:uncharacterized protein (TIGR02246 family)
MPPKSRSAAAGRAEAPAATAARNPTPGEIAAVAAVTQRVVSAWAAHDATAFAQVFAADATLVLPGLFRKGREEIRAHMSAAFKGPYKGTQVTGAPLDLRFLGRNVAVIVTQGGVLAPGETEVAGARAIRATWVVVKRDGHWQLAAYHNSQRD